MSLKPTPYTEGAELRRSMVATLPLTDQQLLKNPHLCAAAPDGRTEADVFLVLRGINPGKSGRAAIETDSAPRIVASHVEALDKFPHDTEFCVPLHVVHEAMWRVYVPSFDEWLLTSGRYPYFNDASQTCAPQRSNAGGNNVMKKPSEVDKVEVYFGFFAGTLGQFWSTGAAPDAINLWRILHTLRSVLDDQVGKEVAFERFAELVEKRDATHEDAVAFKRVMSDCKPSSFYANTLRAMGERPEVVHKARFMNLDYMLLGLMTLGANNNQEDDVSVAHADAILRTILERTIHYASHKNMRDFVDREELVRFLHTSVGGQIEASLRWWAFFVTLLRRLVLAPGPVLGPQQFVDTATLLRKECKEFAGGMAGLALLISPECTMRDDDLAELVLMSSEADKGTKKFATLQLQLDGGATPLLDALLTNNIERLQKTEADAAQLMVSMAIKQEQDQEEKKSTEVEAEAEAEQGVEVPWEEFRTSKQWVHSGNPATVEAYIRMIVALARLGTRPLAIDYAMIQANSNKLFGSRRSKTIVRAFASEGTPVAAMYGIESNAADNFSGCRSKNRTKALLRDLYTSTGAGKLSAQDQIKKTKQQHGAAPGGAVVAIDQTPATFVKFDMARQMTREWMLRVAAMQGELKFQCPICLDEHRSKPVVLHGDYRHAVCTKCATQLPAECPYCRVSLAPQ